jgi:chemotaxis regulatin CheY-phosphate phosphatase CheZ
MQREKLENQLKRLEFQREEFEIKTRISDAKERRSKINNITAKSNVSLFRILPKFRYTVAVL